MFLEILVIWLLINLLFFLFPRIIHSPKKHWIVEKLLKSELAVISHRGGVHECIENSLEMIEYAEKLGLIGVETDVVRTKDN